MISECAHVSSSRLYEILCSLRDLQYIRLFSSGSGLYCGPLDRVRLALYALRNGVDVNRISLALSWKEFEKICSLFLSSFDYVIYRNFRFKFDGRRYELDVIGVRKPFLVCVDCKRWSAYRSSVLKLHSIKHFNRVKALASLDFYSEFGLSNWNEAVFIPVMVTIFEDLGGSYAGIPIVSILKFNSFVDELFLGVDSIRKIVVKL